MKVSELFPDVIAENLEYEFKAHLNADNPIKWAKCIVGFANDNGGIIFVGVSNDREAFGIDLDEIDRSKNLIALINDRHIFPHAKIQYMLRSVDENAERFVLAVKVSQANSIVRYKEGDFNEKVFVKGDGNTPPANPEDIISLSKRKYGIDNEITDILFNEDNWSDYILLCKEYRNDSSIPTIKELQNEEILSKDGYVKSGFLMFENEYSGDDSLICCRLWDSKDKTGTVIDNGRYKGSLVKVFSRALNFIDRNTKNGWRKTSHGGREKITSYPKEAVREALINAIAHRDYSIAGTQIDIDIYADRIEIVSPGSWLLPKGYDQYPSGSIPSIRRNSVIAACLDIANLMERGGTGFQTMLNSYKGLPDNLQPSVTIYPGFLKLSLYDKLYKNDELELPQYNELSDNQKVLEILKREGPKKIKELQSALGYNNRGYFLREIINPLIEAGMIYRDGEPKSPTSVIKITQKPKK